MSVEVNMYIALVMRLGHSQICHPCTVSIYLYKDVIQCFSHQCLKKEKSQIKSKQNKQKNNNSLRALCKLC